MKHTKWEYRIWEYPIFSKFAFTEWLNKKGELGWELVYISKEEPFVYIFKRKYQDD